MFKAQDKIHQSMRKNRDAILVENRISYGLSKPYDAFDRFQEISQELIFK